MTLEASVAVRRGALDLAVDLVVGAGEVLAVLGPNGAGKSTLARVLAGLLRPDTGQVTVDGRVWDGSGGHVPAHRRSLGMVFQDALLFPHLTVAGNVEFGLRSRGVGAGERAAAAQAWLERVGLAGFAGRRPAELSGGQAQRVALADRVVVLEEGCAVQEGTPDDVSRRPRTDYVARLVGLSLLAGTADGRSVRLDGGGVVAVAEEATGPVFAAVRPESVALYLSRPDGSPRNVWPARLVGATPHGATVRCELDGEVPLIADVTAPAFAELGLVPGAQVWATVKASEVAVYAR